MTHLPAPEFHRLDAALRRVPFNVLFAQAVIDGRVDGRVWLDDDRNPSLVHVVHSYGMSLLIVLDARADRDLLLAHLQDARRTHGALWLQVHPQEFAPVLDALLQVGRSGDAGAQRYTRVNFRFERARYEARHPEPPLASGTAVRRVTPPEFALPGIAVSPHMFWRDNRQFLAHGGGWCVDEDGTATSIAFTSFREGARLELGVATLPAHRGRGHAKIACAALIGQCLDENLEPVWSCRKENVASFQLAQSLGFVPTFEGAYYHLPATDAA